MGNQALEHEAIAFLSPERRAITVLRLKIVNLLKVKFTDDFLNRLMISGH